MNNPLTGTESITSEARRIRDLRKVAVCLAVMLFFKVLFSILSEYRWYFPANFDASRFLIGREPIFHGLYRVAFYTHIIVSPVAIALGLFLVSSGGRSRFGKLHRGLGRVQILLVVLFVAPSGLVMSTQAFSGPIAAWGFAVLAILTAATAWLTMYYACVRQFARHRQWAVRGFVLLCSPLLLRLIAGAGTVLEVEWSLYGPLNAWLSWLVPLMVLEVWVCRRVSVREVG